MNTLYTIIVFSENVAGALNQITNVFTRHQLNIESLNACPSGVDGVHRYTITTKADEKTIALVCRQIEKKIDVIQAQYYTMDKVFTMEHALYKLDTQLYLASDQEYSRPIRKYDAKFVEVNRHFSIVAQEGSHREITELYYILKDSGFLRQCVASGIIAVTREKHEKLEEYLAKRELANKAENKG